MASRDFQDQLIQFLPKMRVWALGLTRNAAAADDLVQDVALKTLMANESFVPGTNFSAWVHRIMINQFISTVRRVRETADIGQVPEMAVAASQQDSTDLREASRAFRRLPEDQKRALHLIVIEEKLPADLRRERLGDRHIEESGSSSPPATASGNDRRSTNGGMIERVTSPSSGSNGRWLPSRQDPLKIPLLPGVR